MIAVYPPREAKFVAEENIIVGNVVLYGALRFARWARCAVPAVPAVCPLEA